jgi:glycerol kinase
MSADCILAIDQGTTTSRAVVVGADGTVMAEARCEFPQQYPQPGWVEHDLQHILDSVLQAVAQAVAATPGGWGRIAAIGITNQRETVGVWERDSGRPVANAIVWQCRRTAEVCEALRTDAGEEITSLTGLPIDPYFSGPKLQWLLDQTPGLRGREAQLAAGTIDTWLIYKLSGGAALVTDPTNASRTMLYDIDRRCWSPRLLELMRVPDCVLPQVLPSGGHFAETVAQGPVPAGIPIYAVMGDQQSALFGQGCTSPGQAKNTYGTGCFLLANTGLVRPHSRAGLITTLACDAAGEACYALEGSVFIAGAVVQWLRDGLGIIGSADEVETLAASVPDCGGVSLVPAFVGLGAPYWDPEARGAILGLTRGAGRAHLARAALEAIAHQTADVLEAMTRDGATVGELRVDGGASRNDLLMQMQADLCGLGLLRPGEVEMTALGAAHLAGLVAGLWPSAPEPDASRATRFAPVMSADDRQTARQAWKQAVARVRSQYL